MNKKSVSKAVVIVSFIYFIWLIVASAAEVFGGIKIFFSLKEWSIIGIFIYIVLLLIEVYVYFTIPEKKTKEMKIVSEVMKKVVCSECKTKFTISDTGVRPLPYTCPNCGKEGTLRGKVIEGKSRFVTCSNCQNEFEIFDTEERPLYYECPQCHFKGAIS